jgi:hypothetical protein
VARARIRSFKPELFQDEKVCDLTRDQRLLLFGLVSMADDEGRLREMPTAILGHTFPSDDDVTPAKLARWLGAIEKQGIVLRYKAGGKQYIAFRHWARHQKVNRPTPSTFPPPPDPVVVRENSVKQHGSITDESVNESLNDHGSFTPPRAGAGSDPIPSVPDPSLDKPASEREDTEEIRHPCQLLADLIEANGCKRPTPAQVKGWRRDVRLMVEQDGRTLEQIDAAIRWSQQHEFWRGVVLSMGKVRENWDKMRLQAQRAGGSKAEGNLAVLRSLQGGAA